MQRLITSLLLGMFLAANAAAVDIHLAGVVTVPGDATDLFGGSGVNQNRLGGFGSSLYYDPVRNEYLSLVDRGPGGGVVPFETRMQVFGLDINPVTGVPSNFQLKKTIPFRTADGSAPFNGLAPGRLNGDSSILGLSLDPEGLAVAPNGHFYIADEYGPAIYEFMPVDIGGGQTQARFVRSLTMPDRIIPRDANGNIDYDAVRAPSPPNPENQLVSGRQENRGFEGIAITPDGTKLLAIVQDPLAEEGSSNQGRNSRNTRFVEFDVASGMSTRQFIYQMTDRNDANNIIWQTNVAAAIAANAQGRTLVLSDILAINDHEFLVIERENRGIGSDNPAGTDPILSVAGLKHIWRVDTTGATDVSAVSLRGTNSLTTPALPGNPDPPITIQPVGKRGFYDILANLKANGLVVPEKIEGITWGPPLANGLPTLILTTDNDVSVSQAAVPQEGGGGQILDKQFEIYTMGTQVRWTELDDTSKSYVNILNAAGPDYLVDQGPLPAGFAPLPTYIYSVVVPEPSTWVLVLVCAAGVGVLARKRLRQPAR